MSVTLEQRLLAMEQRLAALETENAELKQAAAAEVDPRKELTPMELYRIKELARDTMRYGYDAAMALHGRKTARQQNVATQGKYLPVKRKNAKAV